MILQQSIVGDRVLPFARSVSLAKWPTDIPVAARRMWDGNKKNFSAIWRVPARSGFDALRVTLLRRFLVIVVRRGRIKLGYGDSQVYLVANQAAAVSASEVMVEVFDCGYGDAVFELNLFDRVPPASHFGCMARLVESQKEKRGNPPGIFAFGNALPLLAPSGIGFGENTAFFDRLFACGLASAIQFIASSGSRSHSEKRGRPEVLLARSVA